MPEGWARDRRWQGTHLILLAFGVVEFREGAMEVERHVCPAAEEDQGTGLVGQVSLVHFDMGFVLGIKDNHRLESHAHSGSDTPAFSTTPTSSLLYQPQPTALSQRPEET